MAAKDDKPEGAFVFAERPTHTLGIAVIVAAAAPALFDLSLARSRDVTRTLAPPLMAVRSLPHSPPASALAWPPHPCARLRPFSSATRSSRRRAKLFRPSGTSRASWSISASLTSRARSTPRRREPRRPRPTSHFTPAPDTLLPTARPVAQVSRELNEARELHKFYAKTQGLLQAAQCTRETLLIKLQEPHTEGAGKKLALKLEESELTIENFTR